MVLSYVQQHGQIKRAEVIELCHLTKDQAFKLLKKMIAKDLLIVSGRQSAAVYHLKSD